ncbi:DUF359 domain-containing protein [Candidatus Micrarchaeota archaeon]|nr:DUF359 domain-containing protein [Candidatus Micrarchaeota archaeon]
MKISETAKEQLKQPLGELHSNFKKIRELGRDHRIISVGDVCTLSLLAAGIKPHLAVFDYRSMRAGMDKKRIDILKIHYNNPREYKNPAGTVSDEIIRDAGKLIEEGGAILINGEEDLTALAFIAKAKEKDVVVYGQPEQGIVIVIPDKKTREKVSFLLRSSS